MLDVKLDRAIEFKIYDYALEVGRKIMQMNKDLNPAVRFQFDSKNPNHMIMLHRNDDAATFFAQLEYQIKEKFIIDGAIDAKIYYLLLFELGLMKK
jgi:hypothetical protein